MDELNSSLFVLGSYVIHHLSIRENWNPVYHVHALSRLGTVEVDCIGIALALCVCKLDGTCRSNDCECNLHVCRLVSTVIMCTWPNVRKKDISKITFSTILRYFDQ